jgi:hypothetical protein
MIENFSKLALPNFPKPKCRVKLICGPPASGKSSYWRTNARPGDIIIDLDLIAHRLGYSRLRPPRVIGQLLVERNSRLATLAYESAERVAWFVVSAPSKSLRKWWSDALNVRTEDVVLLVPERAELRRRVYNDPSRRRVLESHLNLIDQWFIKEAKADAG